jgi:hypothetical protein
VNAAKRGPEECPGHWIPKSKIEGFVIEKIRNYIPSEQNLLELVSLTHEELETNVRDEQEQLKSVNRLLSDVESRLNHSYDALETGAFTSEELAPRIRILQARREELERSKQDIKVALQSSVFELPDINVVRSYIEALRSLLVSSSILEQRALLKSFVEEIRIGKEAS